MALREYSPPAQHDLCLELERHVQNRTGRQVRGLQVQLLAERVVLNGRAATFYVKQLAQHGVWDLLPQARLENAIVVER